MNPSAAAFAQFLAAWLADYYLLATLLLGVGWLAFRWVRQPARRLAIAWIVMIELALLAVVCGLPGWPRISVLPSWLSGGHLPESDGFRAHFTASSLRQQQTDPPPHTPRRLPDTAGSDAGPGPDTPVSLPPLETAGAIGDWKATSFSALLSGGFLAGLVLAAAWLGFGAFASARLCRRAFAAEPTLAAELSQIVFGPLRPRLLLSRQIHTAAALGLWRPTILLPAALVENASRQTLRAALRHEWAHIGDHHLWLLALGRCLLTILFAHPLYWWLRRAIRDDQEAVADALAAEENRHEYAEELLRCVRFVGAGPAVRAAAVGIWENSSRLTRRIAMLLDDTIQVQTAASSHWKWQVAGLLALLGMALSLVTLQPGRSAAEHHPPVSVAALGASSPAAAAGKSKDETPADAAFAPLASPRAVDLLKPVAGKNFAIVPFRTAAQRAYSAKYADAKYFVLINGTAVINDDDTLVNTAELDFHALDKAMQAYLVAGVRGTTLIRIAKTSARRAASPKQGPTPITTMASTLLMTYFHERARGWLGNGEVEVVSHWETPESWESVVADLTKIPTEDDIRAEAGIGDDLVKVYPVRTGLSRCLYGHDAVLWNAKPFDRFTPENIQAFPKRVKTYVAGLNLPNSAKLCTLENRGASLGKAERVHHELDPLMDELKQQWKKAGGPQSWSTQIWQSGKPHFCSFLVVKVVDQDGKPVSNVTVTARYAEVAYDPVWRTWTAHLTREALEKARAYRGHDLRQEIYFQKQDDARFKSEQIFSNDDFTVTVNAQGYKASSQQLNLPSGESRALTKELEIKLQRSTP